MSSNPSGTRAVVAGAGIGGLVAAAALAPLFDSVTVFEKDELPEGPRVRKGVAQGDHVHTFLIGGVQSLGELLPGIADDFEAAGAASIDAGNVEFFHFGKPRPRRELGLAIRCLSRPAYEHIIRRRVLALPNVELRQRARIDGVEFDGGRAVGLRLRDAGVERADLVVDATGRGAGLVRQLEEQGYGQTPELSIGIEMCYASARLRLDDRWRGDEGVLCLPLPPDKRLGVMLPIENGECILSLGGRSGTEPGADVEGFLAYAEQMAWPGIFERIRDAEFLTPIHKYHKPTANWRRYDMLERFPEGLAPLGDTISSFNPTWAQGMTVAIRHALALRSAIREHGVAGPSLVQTYLPLAAAVSQEAWETAALIDLAYPEVSGERPPNMAQTLAFMGKLRMLADEDPEIHKLQIEVLQMVKSPLTLRDPALMARVAALAP